MRSSCKDSEATAATESPNPADPNLASNAPGDKVERGSTDGPFAIGESDPTAFTTLVRAPGAQRLRVVGLDEIEPWVSGHLYSTPIYPSASYGATTAMRCPRRDPLVSKIGTTVWQSLGSRTSWVTMLTRPWRFRVGF